MLVGASLLGAMIAVPAGAQEVDPGKGNAYAQGVKVDPVLGQLSFGVTVGQALSGHQNSQSIAEARSVDLGVLGVTLAGEGCDGGDPTLPKEQQPQPLVSRTDDKGGPRNKPELAVQREVDSRETPFAEARAVVGGLGDMGAAVIGPVESHTTSGVIDGRRVARAETTVARFGIPGVLEISGMRWVAEYQTEPEEATVTEFSIDGIKVLNTSLIGELLKLVADLVDVVGLGSLVNIPDPLQNLEQVNQFLAPLGISITSPKAYVENGTAFVDPLRISVAPRIDVVGDVMGIIQPIREAITGAIIAADCGNATYVTIADLVLGTVTGAGGLHLELGGVYATTADIDRFEFPPFTPPAGAPVPTTPPASLNPTGGFTAPSLGNSGVGTVPVTDDDDDEVAAPVTEDVAVSTPLGVRGGKMIGVGLGVLALLAGLAELDRRKMRKAQRSVPMFATDGENLS